MNNLPSFYEFLFHLSVRGAFMHQGFFLIKNILKTKIIITENYTNISLGMSIFLMSVMWVRADVLTDCVDFVHNFSSTSGRKMQA